MSFQIFITINEIARPKSGKIQLDDVWTGVFRRGEHVHIQNQFSLLDRIMGRISLQSTVQDIRSNLQASTDYAAEFSTYALVELKKRLNYTRKLHDRK